MPVGQMHVGQMPVDKLLVDKTPVGQMPVCQMDFDQKTWIPPLHSKDNLALWFKLLNSTQNVKKVFLNVLAYLGSAAADDSKDVRS